MKIERNQIQNDADGLPCLMAVFSDGGLSVSVPESVLAMTARVRLATPESVADAQLSTVAPSCPLPIDSAPTDGTCVQLYDRFGIALGEGHYAFKPGRINTPLKPWHVVQVHGEVAVEPFYWLPSAVTVLHPAKEAA